MRKNSRVAGGLATSSALETTMTNNLKILETLGDMKQFGECSKFRNLVRASATEVLDAPSCVASMSGFSKKYSGPKALLKMISERSFERLLEASSITAEVLFGASPPDLLTKVNGASVWDLWFKVPNWGNYWVARYL